jgi:hypothetical protein
MARRSEHCGHPWAPGLCMSSRTATPVSTTLHLVIAREIGPPVLKDGARDRILLLVNAEDQHQPDRCSWP